MGACLSHQSSSHRALKPHLLIDLPSTSNLSIPASKNDLEFIMEIYNLTIVGQCQSLDFLKVGIVGGTDITLRKTDADKNPLAKIKNEIGSKTHNELKWSTHHTQTLVFPESSLHLTYLQIAMYQTTSTLPISSIKMNLSLVISGPIHHNMEIAINGQKCRILFDCKIAQIIQCSFQVQSMQIEMGGERSGEVFNFNVNAYIQEDLCFKSQSSHPIKVPLNFFKAENQQFNGLVEDECASPNPMLKHRMSSQSQNQQLTHNLNWKSQKSDSNKYLPSFSLDVNVAELPKHHLKFLLWNLQKEGSQAIYFGETNVSFWKIFEKDLQIVDFKADGSTVKVEQRKIQLEKDFKLQQKTIGKAKIMLVIRNQTFFKQTKYSTRTQQGVMKIVPAFKNYQNLDAKSNNKAILQLWQSSQKIEKYFHGSQCGDSPKKISLELDKINETLISSHSTSFMLWHDNQEQVLHNQNILLTMLQKIFVWLQEEAGRKWASTAWEIIINIVKRGEFYLENLSLKNDGKKFDQKKKQIALKYQQILFKLLASALGYTDLYPFQQIQQVQTFKAFCYFRIPPFRSYFLQNLESSPNQELIQNRLQDLQINLEPHTSVLKIDKSAKLKLNWQKYFFQPIKNQRQSQIVVQELYKALKHNMWLKQLCKRSQMFFYFVDNTIKTLSQVQISTDPLKWKYFPGYNKLICAFLSQMKKRPVSKYSTQMISTSLNILSNEYLINILMQILCERTRVFQIEEVNVTIEILNEYLDIVSQKGKKILPHGFNYGYLMNVIKSVMTGQHCYSMIKILALIYDCYPSFSLDFKNKICVFLLGKVFFKLFFHWSYDIRGSFYNFLVVRISYGGKSEGLAHRDKKISVDLSRNVEKVDENKRMSADFASRPPIIIVIPILIKISAQIQERYRRLIQMIQMIEKVKREQVKNEYMLAYEKLYYKKMKKKMNHKFKQKQLDKSKTFSQPYQMERLKLMIQKEQMGRKRSTDFKTTQQFENTFVLMKGMSTFENLSIPQNKHGNGKFSNTLVPPNQESEVMSPSGDSIPDFSKYQMDQFVPRKSQDHESSVSKRRKRKLSVVIPDRPFLRAYQTKAQNCTFIENLDEMPELSKQEISNIEKGCIQFREMEEWVDKYLFVNGELPQRKFAQTIKKKELAA